MTGADLIKWIQDNHAENLDVHYYDDCCGNYPVEEVIIENRNDKTYILIE